MEQKFDIGLNAKLNEFTKKFGITRKTLSAIENGKSNISLNLAFKIASYYDIPVEDIFENKYRFNSKEKFDKK